MKARVHPSPDPRYTTVQYTAPDVKDEVLKKYLEDYATLCKRYRDAYNIHAVHLKNRHNFITFPLLVITSATGVLASLEIPKTAGVIVGAASAVLTAIQRYCSYAERSENARMTAKSHAKIIRKIENMQLIMDSPTVNTPDVLFSKFLREIQSEIDSTHENAKDVPWELLRYIDTIDAKVGCFSVQGPQINPTPPNILNESSDSSDRASLVRV